GGIRHGLLRAEGVGFPVQLAGCRRLSGVVDLALDGLGHRGGGDDQGGGDGDESRTGHLESSRFGRSALLANASPTVKAWTGKRVTSSDRAQHERFSAAAGGGGRRLGWLGALQLEVHQVIAQGVDLLLRIPVEELARRGG